MDRNSYILISVVIAAAFAVLAVWAYRSGGRGRLWAAWLGATATLGALAIFLTQRTPTSETPFMAYLLVAIVPTLAATAFVDIMGRRQQPAAVQVLGAGAICWVLMPGMLLLGTYGIGS